MNTSEEKHLEVIEHVESTLVERERAGVNSAEADYISGAITVMVTMFGEDVSIPPMWIIYPMSGRSLAKELMKK